MEKTTILEKVNFILGTVKTHNITPDNLQRIVELSKEHTDNLVLGRVFGWSVSDYAVAALKWIGTDEAQKEYDRIIQSLSKERREEIRELIEREIYKQY